MPTFLDLRTKVLRRVIDAPAAITTEVPDLIRAAVRQLQTRHNFKVMQTQTALLSTVVDTRSLGAVPTDFKEWRARPYYVEELGRTRDIATANSREAALDLFGEDVDVDIGPPAIILDGEPDDDGVRNFEVFPYPDGNSDYDNGEYRIRIPYWRFLPALSADADEDWFTTNADEYIVHKAVGEAFAVDWDEERMAVWEQTAAAKFDLVVQQDKKFWLAGAHTLVPHRGANSPKIVR